MGLLRKTTDASEDATLFDYDPFGRQTWVTFPDLSYITFTRDHEGDSRAQHLDVSSSVGLSTRYYIDGFGDVHRTVRHRDRRQVERADLHARRARLSGVDALAGG